LIYKHEAQGLSCSNILSACVAANILHAVHITVLWLVQYLIIALWLELLSCQCRQEASCQFFKPQ